MKVLLVEDHQSLGESLREVLAGNRLSVDWVRTIDGAEAAMQSSRYDLMLLDLGLPDGDGRDLIRSCRRNGNSLPILVLTARGGLNDRIDGLDNGADDYLVKPFDLNEMLSRCRALLRRPANLASERLMLGALSIDVRAASILVNDQPLVLPRREYQLLTALVRRAGRVCSREYLENAIYDLNTQASPNALEVMVSRLRAVLSEKSPELSIRTIRGIGYTIEELAR
jgi:DNA-binding response OmpR family regulator